MAALGVSERLCLETLQDDAVEAGSGLGMLGIFWGSVGFGVLSVLVSGV